MAELNEIRILLVVLLTVLPAHALNVLFSPADEDFKQKSEINIDIEHGEKIYNGTLNPLTYQPKFGTSKVIVYIIDGSRFIEIVRYAVRNARLQIAQELSEWHCELVFLGIEHFDDDEYHLISGFLADKFRRVGGQTNYTIEIIGENRFDRVYHRNVMKYQENAQICGGTLQKSLRDIAHGALRPVGMNGKKIKLRGYHPPGGESEWSVGVINNTYSPQVNVTIPKYNFRIRFQTKKLCLLILSGKEYMAIKGVGRLTTKLEISKILDKMTENDEGLFILGVFNFHWTEIYLVTQIILQHSVGFQGPNYNVFTCGYGMFNSFYLNWYEPDGRYILPQSISNVSEAIKALMGKEVKQRSITMYCSSYGWTIPINLHNGRYAVDDRYENFTIPCVDQNIAFIVYDSSEKNNPIDVSIVSQSMRELKRSGIYVILIEAFNFGLHDIRIIAQWADYHRGKFIPAEQIAILGCGFFDTIFQSESTTYKRFHNTKKNELETIRNALVKKGNGKRVFSAQINAPNFEVWTYPMQTVNGFYEPDLIPDRNMFDATNGRNIFFIITSGNHFEQISRVLVKDTNPINWLKRKIEGKYPCSECGVFLVGLDNFEERDYHLFVDLVKKQTYNNRPLQDFVRTFLYGIGSAAFQFEDTEPIKTEIRSRIISYIKYFFEMTCELAAGPSSH